MNQNNKEKEMRAIRNIYETQRDSGNLTIQLNVPHFEFLLDQATSTVDFLLSMKQRETRIKQVSDMELDIVLAKALNYVSLRNHWDIYHKQFGSIPCYTRNIAFAKKAEAKVLEKDSYSYIQNLRWSIKMDHPEGDEHLVQGIALLLKATARQISEAVYLTVVKEEP